MSRQQCDSRFAARARALANKREARCGSFGSLSYLLLPAKHRPDIAKVTKHVRARRPIIWRRAEEASQCATQAARLVVPCGTSRRTLSQRADKGGASVLTRAVTDVAWTDGMQPASLFLPLLLRGIFSI